MNRKRITAIICALSMIGAIAGCGKTTVVEEYPTQAPEAVSNIDDNTEPEEPEKTEIDDEMPKDSLRTYGSFYYNPTMLGAFGYNNDLVSPEIRKDAIVIMQAVYNHEATVDLSDYAPDPTMVNVAMSMAQASSPICELCNVENEGDGVYRIVYGLEDSIFTQTVSQYEEKLTEAINDTIDPSDTDDQRAYKMYKYLVENMEFDYDSIENMSKSQQINHKNSALAAFVEGCGDYDNFIKNYLFILIQLGVDSNLKGALGSYNEQEDNECEILDEAMLGATYYYFNTIYVNNSWYNCDITFEKIRYDAEKKANPDADYQYSYFGMSDETREKSWHSDSWGLMLPGNKNDVVCNDDLVL